MKITCLIAAADKPQNTYSYYPTRTCEKAKPVKAVESYNLHNHLAKVTNECREKSQGVYSDDIEPQAAYSLGYTYTIILHSVLMKS